MPDPKRPADIPADIAAMSFEEALRALEGIVSQLERGQTTLEDSIDQYERGTALRKHCETKLTEAERKIERIAGTGPDGAPKTAPLDPS